MICGWYCIWGIPSILKFGHLRLPSDTTAHAIKLTTSNVSFLHGLSTFSLSFDLIQRLDLPFLVPVISPSSILWPSSTLLTWCPLSYFGSCFLQSLTVFRSQWPESFLLPFSSYWLFSSCSLMLVSPSYEDTAMMNDLLTVASPMQPPWNHVK